VARAFTAAARSSTCPHSWRSAACSTSTPTSRPRARWCR
jgi:hypothetical protein